MLAVNETFYSVQGEGMHMGMPSFFIRLQGCNLACTWCDTPYASRTHEGGRELDVFELVARVAECPDTAHIVVTGGEPMLQADLFELCGTLQKLGRVVTVETNATIAPGGLPCALGSLSPKLPGSQPDGTGGLDALVAAAWMARGDYQFKFVVSDAADIASALQFLGTLPVAWDPARVFMMPEGRNPAVIAERTALVVEECKRLGLRYGRRLQLDLFGDEQGT